MDYSYITIDEDKDTIHVLDKSGGGNSCDLYKEIIEAVLDEKVAAVNTVGIENVSVEGVDSRGWPISGKRNFEAIKISAQFGWPTQRWIRKCKITKNGTLKISKIRDKIRLVQESFDTARKIDDKNRRFIEERINKVRTLEKEISLRRDMDYVSCDGNNENDYRLIMTNLSRDDVKSIYNFIRNLLNF